MNHSNENLDELKKQNKKYVKALLMLERVMMLSCLVSFLVMLYAGVEIVEDVTWKILLIVSSILVLGVNVVAAIFIEQFVGYYECRWCKNRYVPKYFTVFIAMHIGRTRYMRCPKCNKKSWNKKVLTK